MKTLLSLAASSLLMVPDHAPDKEGFIRHWLVLAPVPSAAEDAGAAEIDADPLGGEAKLAPKAGDKAKAYDREYAWKEHAASDYFIDFRESFGAERGEDAVAWAVTYVTAEADLEGVKLQVGSNDQCKVYLNGSQVLKSEETRTLDKDQNAANVTLKKGRNVVVFKVANEKNNWQGCLRFTDASGKPVTSLKVSSK